MTTIGVSGARALPADRLAGLALGFRRDRAGIDDDGIGEARRFRMAANDLRLIGVEPAPEGDDLDAHGAAPTISNSAWSNRPARS